MSDQQSARAACEAGYLSLPDYLEMAAQNDWAPNHSFLYPPADNAGGNPNEAEGGGTL